MDDSDIINKGTTNNQPYQPGGRVTCSMAPKVSRSKTPAVAGHVLVKGDEEGRVSSKQIKMHLSATVTCMFMMQWSRPDIFIAVRGLARPRLPLGRLMSAH